MLGISSKFEKELNKEVEECLNFFKIDDKIPNERLPLIIKYFGFVNEEEEINLAKNNLLIESENSFFVENAKDYLLARLMMRQPIDYFRKIFQTYADKQTQTITNKTLVEIIKNLRKEKKDKEGYVKELIRDGDYDNDGVVKEEDFITAVKNVYMLE